MENSCPITTTDNPEQPGSQVARCLREIADEYSAAQRGLHSYATVSRHAFITARMEAMTRGYDELVKVVGEDAAVLLAAERLDQVQVEAQGHA